MGPLKVPEKVLQGCGDQGCGKRGGGYGGKEWQLTDEKWKGKGTGNS